MRYKSTKTFRGLFRFSRGRISEIGFLATQFSRVWPYPCNFKLSNTSSFGELNKFTTVQQGVGFLGNSVFLDSLCSQTSHHACGKFRLLEPFATYVIRSRSTATKALRLVTSQHNLNFLVTTARNHSSFFSHSLSSSPLPRLSQSTCPSFGSFRRIPTM